MNALMKIAKIHQFRSAASTVGRFQGGKLVRCEIPIFIFSKSDLYAVECPSFQGVFFSSSSGLSVPALMA